MNVRWTGVEELDSVLGELVNMAQEVLGGDLVGVYLQGSFALGGADEESDCDFLVVTATPVAAARLGALRAFHSALPHRAGYWDAHLEGSYALFSDLADPSRVGRPWWYVGHGSDRVVLDAHCNTDVTRWILSRHGKRLHGPDPSTFTSPVPVAVMRSSGRTRLVDGADEWARFDGWDAWSQRYAVVSLPRMLRTCLVGDVLSKPAAVAWATGVLDSRWHSLMLDALTARGQRPWNAPVEDRLVARTLDFVRYVKQVAVDTATPDT